MQIQALFCLLSVALSGAIIQPAIAQNGQPPKAQVLDLLVKKAPKPDYDAPVPDQISGRVVVYAGRRMAGVAGVSVMGG